MNSDDQSLKRQVDALTQQAADLKAKKLQMQSAASDQVKAQVQTINDKKARMIDADKKQRENASNTAKAESTYPLDDNIIVEATTSDSNTFKHNGKDHALKIKDMKSSHAEFELHHDGSKWDLSNDSKKAYPHTSKAITATGFLNKVNKQWKTPSGNMSKDIQLGNVYHTHKDAEPINTHYGQDLKTNYIQVTGAGFYHTGNDEAKLGSPELVGKTDFRASMNKRKAKNGKYSASVIMALKDPKKSMHDLDAPLKEYTTMLQVTESRNNADALWDKAEEHLASANKHKGNKEAYHFHMSNHHDVKSQYHADLGQHRQSDVHADKAEEHHDKSLQAAHNGLAESEEIWVSESSLNPKDPHKDYQEKSKVLQGLMLNKDVDQKHVGQRKLDLDREYAKIKEETELEEAHKIHDKVEIIKGSAKGTRGHIGEIRHGLYKGAPKTYTVYHGENDATQVSKEHIRAIKESDEAWAASLEKKKEDRLTPNDKDKLDKVRAMLAKEKKPVKETKYWSKTGKTAKHNETGEETHEYAEYDDEKGDATGKREYRNAKGKSMGESVEQIEEGSFKYHMDKAVTAHDRGDANKKEYHLGNAKTARYAMKTTDYAKNRDLLAKYKQMTEAVDIMANLRQAHDRHMAKALTANKAGDDAACKVHQTYMQKIQDKMQKLKRNEETMNEEHLIHVSDGSKYGDKPSKKDIDHVMAGVKAHNGEHDGSSDKGAFFKFKSHSDAENFKRHVDKCPGKTCYADHSESTEFIAPSLDETWSKEQLANVKSLHTKMSKSVGLDPSKKYGTIITKSKKDKEMDKAIKDEMNEISNATLTSYKQKAGEQASAADKAGDFKKGNKRFSGIIKATKKQFANDLKKEDLDESRGHKIIATFFKNRESWNKAANERDAKHDEIEKKRQAEKAAGKENMSSAIDRLAKHVNEEGEGGVAANNAGDGKIAGFAGDAGKKAVMSKKILQRKTLADFKKFVSQEHDEN